MNQTFAPKVDFFDVVQSISKALDYAFPHIVSHHVRVAYAALRISRSLRHDRQTEANCLISGMLHDIGILYEEHADDAALLDARDDRHALIGYHLLKEDAIFGAYAPIIRYHHSFQAGHPFAEHIPIESQILNLADMVDPLIREEKNLIEQRQDVRTRLDELVGQGYPKELVHAYRRLIEQDDFWLDLWSSDLPGILKQQVKRFEIEFDAGLLVAYAQLMAHLVDFKSRFTSTHSSGVAATAEYIARIIGFSEVECIEIQAAGLLHDVGKIAIPNQILEKNGTLTPEEFERVKAHAYYTNKILDVIQGIDRIKTFCAYHHEKLNACGYPYSIPGAQIPLIGRIISVADIFTALTEDRPYRKGMDEASVRQIFCDMVDKGELDIRITRVLMENYKAINQYREMAQEQARSGYISFINRIHNNPA
ncbi:HD domain-containing phosphohydrolase [Magnetococcus sp. PR-3]|uniref:HD domain-containing phosphohydrolase n=1 Tax=Magnetococcus sp. PR-3 TaxID=3120355 RepID=UPI002FCE5FFD